MNGVYEQLPYQPCVCGVPCPPPVPKTLRPGETALATWGMISRKCKGSDAEERKMTDGTFRLKISYQLVDNGLIKETNGLWVVVTLGE